MPMCFVVKILRTLYVPVMDSPSNDRYFCPLEATTNPFKQKHTFTQHPHWMYLLESLVRKGLTSILLMVFDRTILRLV